MKNEAELYDEILEESYGFVDHSLNAEVNGARCESPIERLMFAALYAWLRYRSGMPLVIMGNGSTNSDFENSYGVTRLYYQLPVAGYRVDFALKIRLSKDIVFIIECDGHDYHERTKEQADRARDRKLQALGYTVYRFTGAEIWRSPLKCALEICRDFCKACIADREAAK